MAGINGDWYEALKGEFKKPYYRKLFDTVNQEYRTQQIFPPAQDIFNAFHLTPLKDVKVVILGQDPYHGPGQAHGMCFSVKKGVALPPSLKNIFRELESDMGCTVPPHGCLTEWAEQGVLLLNTVLTVREGQANSHKGQGWEIFTDTVIRHLNRREKPIVFLLWGGNAKAKSSLITSPQHLILTAAHPSPLSARNGFFGCGHFSRTNEFLLENGMKPIRWQIT